MDLNYILIVEFDSLLICLCLSGAETAVTASFMLVLVLHHCNFDLLHLSFSLTGFKFGQIIPLGTLRPFLLKSESQHVVVECRTFVWQHKVSPHESSLICITLRGCR